MSVTFTADKAKVHYEKIPCDFPGCTEGNRCGYCDDGVEHRRVSDAPELNLANGNAAAICRMLSMPDEGGYGYIDATVVPMVRETILGALNARSMRRPLDRATHAYGGPGTGHCRVIEVGNDDDSTMRRLMDLDAVLAWAEENQSAVSWG